MITATVNHARFNAAMDGMREALVGSGKDAATILVDEHRRLTDMIVNFTPPPKHLGNPQEVGEKAIEKDLHSLISEADENTLKPIIDKYGTRDIDTYLSTQTGDKIEVQWENIAIGSEEVAALHEQYRNRQGRPPRLKQTLGFWKSRVVVVKGLRDEYVAAVQERVGRMKAKWAYCASTLGAKFPAYIARHFGVVSGSSTAQVNLTGDNPSIVFGGSGRGFGQTKDAVRDAGNVRAKQMAKRIKYLVGGYAKDIAQGQVPRPHGGESSTEPMEEAA